MHNKGKFVHMDVSISAEDEKLILEVGKKIMSWEDNETMTITLTKLSGGTSNALFRLTRLEKGEVGSNPTKTHVIIKIFGTATSFLLDREFEMKVLEVAQAEGGPEMYGRFQNGCVYGWIPGLSLTPPQLRDDKIREAIAHELGQWHSNREMAQRLLHFQVKHKYHSEGDCQPDQDELKATPILFHRLRKFSNLIPSDFVLPSEDPAYPALSVHDLNTEIEKMEKEMEPEIKQNDAVFCHNDMYAGNIIYDNNTGRVRFIDYEYAQFNFRAYDIANSFCEYGGLEQDWSTFPTPEEQHKFVFAYLKSVHSRDPTESEVAELTRVVLRFTMASNLLWGLWGIVQSVHKPPTDDFNYKTYAQRRFLNYNKNKNQFLFSSQQ